MIDKNAQNAIGNTKKTTSLINLINYPMDTPMSNITPIRTNELEDFLRDLLIKVKRKEVTHVFCLMQKETEEHVSWVSEEKGEKSYDPDHLLAEIGYLYIHTQSVFGEICELAEEENGDNDQD